VHVRAALAPVGGVTDGRRRRRRLGCGRRRGLALALLLAACQPRGGPDLPVALQWSATPDPLVVGPAVFTLALTDTTTGTPVTGAVVRLEGNMSHPGMTPALGEAREVEPGRYQARLDLDMAGDWFLVVDATLPDGRVLHRQVDLPGVRAQ
jgi:hypothetical protein